MGNIELFVLSVALGADLFSVSIPIGMNRIKRSVIFWAATVFAIFHIVFILVGYYAGRWLGSFFVHIETYQVAGIAITMQDWASIAGALVLAALGIFMIKNSLLEEQEENAKNHPLQGVSLMILAFSVSMDALAAGFSMGMLDVNLVKLSVILGIVIFAIAVVGLGLGRKLGSYVGARSELIGGIVLILLSLNVLWSALH